MGREKKLLGKPRRRWANKIEMDVKAKEWEDVNWFKWMWVEEMVGCYEHGSDTSGYLGALKRFMCPKIHMKVTPTNNR